MATSAFKSTSKRTSIGKSAKDLSSFGRTSLHHYAQSLSRFSYYPLQKEYNNDRSTPTPPTRGGFLNKVRGLAFLEISLDDLAIKLFDSFLKGRLNSRNANVNPKNGRGRESVTQIKGRSMLRHMSRSMGGHSSAMGRGICSPSMQILIRINRERRSS